VGHRERSNIQGDKESNTIYRGQKEKENIRGCQRTTQYTMVDRKQEIIHGDTERKSIYSGIK